jgi:hypothetical protein
LSQVKGPTTVCAVIECSAFERSSTLTDFAFSAACAKAWIAAVEAGRGVEKHSNGMPPNLLAHYFYLWKPTVATDVDRLFEPLE